MRTCQTLRTLLVVLLCTTAMAIGQERGQPGTEPPEQKPEQKPGLVQLGPFYLTPLLRLGTIGLDTNVFYTVADRRTDISGSGGPGLRVVVPVGNTFRLVSEGGLNYVYYARTTSLRRLTGDAYGGFDFSGARTSGEARGTYTRSFERLSTEIDQRVDQETKALTGNIRRRLLGRTFLSLNGRLAHTEVPGGQEFLGTDLSKNLTADTLTGAAELGYTLTAKTNLSIEGSADRTRHPLAATRDATTPRLSVGIATSSATLLSGHASVGNEWFIPEDRSLPQTQGLYASVDLAWHLSPRMQIGGGYLRDLTYTAFDTVNGASPVAHRETIQARFSREILHRLIFEASGQQNKTRTEQPVRLSLESGSVVELVRSDTTYEGLGSLAYQITTRLSAGVSAGYGQRRSSISDFGVEGLLVGGKVTFAP
jgi:hypothetical protein